ncbi:MAG: hypothetical protein ACOC87_03835 [Candidatus Natronoplasma sp.]
MQVLGMTIVLLEAIINGIGGTIGGWSLRDMKESYQISSNIKWANIIFLITGFVLFGIGFYWAVTNEMQTCSEGDIAI